MKAMCIAGPFQGSLFAHDFLRDSVIHLDDWRDISSVELGTFEAFVREVFDSFPSASLPNESQTEDDLIWPILVQLGWTASLRQQNLSAHGRADVPDGLLFPDAEAKARANSFAEEWKRYEYGVAVVESKRWGRPIDRRSGRRGEETAPSTQMLRYLRRVDDLTTGGVRWGILTNGARWRLYYQGARSVSEQFFEMNLAALLGLPGYNDGPFAVTRGDRRHWLKVFMLVFRREAFLAGTTDPRTFHQRAIEEGRFYEERVAASLSALVFGQVFPELARAIAANTPESSMPDVREAALVLLYRLLFIFYAEDRDLLPVRNASYDDYALREKVRGDVGRRKDRGDVFSAQAARYWLAIDDLCRAIDQGDASIGLPPYNGGLFDRPRVPLLNNIRLSDEVMANVIDALSFEQTPNGRRYINYRDLGVQQLGTIYERLIEQEIVRDGREIVVRPNVFARKGSGSYYTPDDLVGLIIKETVEPLVQSRMDAFATKISDLSTSHLPEDRKIGQLKRVDPAGKLLDLKICDPAMGSGHFLVNLVDHLADRVIAAMAEAEALIDDYISPLTERIYVIRNTIIGNAEDRGWTIDAQQLDDRHIVRRMVLKRCVYGVDKNPMAVELAKVALWLHTFTVGAPLSFLDHHLRCGNSLFGSWVRAGIDKAKEQGGPLFLKGPLQRATRAAAPMQIIEGLTDAEIAEAHRSAEVFAEIEAMTTPLNAFLSLVLAFDWLHIRSRDDKNALFAYFTGIFGDPVDIASGTVKVSTEVEGSQRFSELLDRAKQIHIEERFFNWQVTFPGVWSEWEDDELHGGFDAVIGNPPWERMKLQQVEWFAARHAEIAHAQRAADRKRMIAALRDARNPLASEFERANERAVSAVRIARTSGDYPYLSRGDVNIYSLFVERAMTLVAPGGMVGLLTPIGIATDKTLAPFFAERIRTLSVKAFFAFENRRGWLFPDIHREEQPSVIVFAKSQHQFSDFDFCVRISSWEQFNNSNRRFRVSANLLRKVNPNTGTVPIFRFRRDAELTTAIYSRLPILVDRSSGGEVKAWPVKYRRMYDMTNDSDLFRTRDELEEQEGAYCVSGNRFASPSGDWVPLYEGKMVQIYNHRYASVRVNPNSISGQGVAEKTGLATLQDAVFVPYPRYWVNETDISEVDHANWRIGFNDICNTNNARSLIACIVPDAGFGNTLPILSIEEKVGDLDLSLMVANLCALVCDYVARQKIQSRHLNKYILEQLPVVPPDRYKAVCFGPKTAGQIVSEAVLELTYTAQDMAPFARDMGYVDEAGNVKPPFIWNEERRLILRSKLDAVFFHLYGVTDRDDVRYIYSTFLTVKRRETRVHGCYYSREVCLAWMNALGAGDPDVEIKL